MVNNSGAGVWIQDLQTSNLSTLYVMSSCTAMIEQCLEQPGPCGWPLRLQDCQSPAPSDIFYTIRVGLCLYHPSNRSKLGPSYRWANVGFCLIQSCTCCSVFAGGAMQRPIALSRFSFVACHHSFQPAWLPSHIFRLQTVPHYNQCLLKIILKFLLSPIWAP